MIGGYAPDVLGLQEANSFQLEELSNEFPQYGQVGEGSMGGSKGQHSAILFLEERFKLTDSGSFWLSENPTQPSKSWRSAHHRICTWAELLGRETDRTLYIYNTHMDDGSREARENGARTIMEHIQGKVQAAPFVFMGDFNAPEDSEALEIIKGNSLKPRQRPMVFKWWTPFAFFTRIEKMWVLIMGLPVSPMDPKSITLW